MLWNKKTRRAYLLVDAVDVLAALDVGAHALQVPLYDALEEHLVHRPVQALVVLAAKVHNSRDSRRSDDITHEVLVLVVFVSTEFGRYTSTRDCNKRRVHAVDIYTYFRVLTIAPKQSIVAPVGFPLLASAATSSCETMYT
jgi:hypothetical protein